MTQATAPAGKCIVNHPYFALINKQMLTKNAVLIDWHQFKLAPKLPLQTLLKPINVNLIQMAKNSKASAQINH